MAFYGISDKYSEKFIPAVVTLSSEQLESINYTETVLTANFPIDINIASAEEFTNIKWHRRKEI